MPKIYVCDPEIARQVFIKEADKFPIRGVGDNFDMGTLGSEFMDLLECMCLIFNLKLRIKHLYE